MFNKTKRILSLLLALALVFSLAACGKAEDSSSDVEVVYEEEIVYVDGEGNSTTGITSGGGTTTQTGSKKPASKSEISSLKGTTVKFATWKNPALNEDAPVVEAFEKKYGITVEWIDTPQAKYPEKIQSMIASGSSPDVYFCTGDFPLNLSCLDPLSKAKIDFNDHIWDQGMFKLTTFDGEPYMCNSVGNIWECVDMVFYNKQLLEQANCYTPEEYDDAGKWNWDAMEEIMTAVKGLGQQYIGGYIATEVALGSVGAGIYNFKDGKFTSGLNNDLVYKVERRMAEMMGKGIMCGSSATGRTSFITGNVGLLVIDAFGLKRTGYFAKMDWSKIGFYHMPDFDASTKAVPTGICRGWGIVKGANNPVGAGVFLRYYLDSNNYDTEKAFISDDASTFFFELTSNIENKNPYHSYMDFIDDITNVDATVGDITQLPYRESADQISAKLDSFKNTVEAGCKNANDFIAKQTAK